VRGKTGWREVGAKSDWHPRSQKPLRRTVTAAEVAREFGVDLPDFLAALRTAGLAWHTYDDRWEVELGSPFHAELRRVCGTLIAKRLAA
jgi:hypothetical protein